MYNENMLLKAYVFNVPI